MQIDFMIPQFIISYANPFFLVANSKLPHLSLYMHWISAEPDQLNAVYLPTVVTLVSRQSFWLY